MRVIDAFSQFFDGEGNPLSGGKLYFYESGSTSTLKDTFSDFTEATPNTNPVILDADGRAGDVFGTGSYRVVSCNSNDIQIQVADPVGGSYGIGAFDDWSPNEIYDISALVTASDGRYYRSKVAGNAGNDPVSSPVQWEEVYIEAAVKFRVYAVSDLLDPTSPSVLTTEETTNTNISNYKPVGGAHVFTLPEPHAGANVMFVIGDEYTMEIEPPDGHSLYLNETALSVDQHIVNTSGELGQFIVGWCSNINGALRWMFASKFYEFAGA